MPSANLEHANFHQIVDDDAAMFMTNLVNGHEEIHVFVEHLVDDNIEATIEDIGPLNVKEPGAEHVGLEVDNVQALEVLDPKVVVDDHVGYARYYEGEVCFEGNESDHDLQNMKMMIIIVMIFMIMMMSMDMLMMTIDMIFQSMVDMIMMRIMDMIMMTRMI